MRNGLPQGPAHSPRKQGKSIGVCVSYVGVSSLEKQPNCYKNNRMCIAWMLMRSKNIDIQYKHNGMCTVLIPMHRNAMIFTAKATVHVLP